MKKIKILHVIPSLDIKSGGPAKAVQSYIRCAQNMLSSDIACLDDGIDESEKKRIQESMPESRIYFFRSAFKGHQKFSIRMFLWILRNVTEYDLMYAHALFSPASTFSMILSRFRKVPYILRPLGTFSGYTFSSGHVWLKWVYFFAFEKRNIRKAALIHFTSSLERKIALEIMKIPQCVIIPIPVEVSVVDQEGPKNSILYFSRIDRKKNLELLIDGFKNFSTKHKGINLIIAGDGITEYIESIRHKVANLNLSERVKFKGHVTGCERLLIFRDAICMALVSENENFGIAVAEALGSGIPVVISKGVAMWADIEACGAGIVVEKNPEGISEALKFYVENKQERKRASDAGIEYVRNKFSHSTIGVLVRNACQEALRAR